VSSFDHLGFISYFCHDGEVWENGKGKAYTRPLRSGEKVGMLLNFEEGTVHFTINGLDQGRASDRLPKNKDMRITVHLGWQNKNKMTLLP